MKYMLRHKATGEFYARMLLGADTRTINPANARQWNTAASAARFNTRFGERYTVVSA